MSPQQLIDIMHGALWLSVMLAGPVLGLSLVVGLFFSIFQAVTSIQEQSLIFVPKMLAAALALILFMGWMAQMLIHYTANLFSQISTVGG